MHALTMLISLCKQKEKNYKAPLLNIAGATRNITRTHVSAVKRPLRRSAIFNEAPADVVCSPRKTRSTITVIGILYAVLISLRPMAIGNQPMSDCFVFVHIPVGVVWSLSTS